MGTAKVPPFQACLFLGIFWLSLAVKPSSYRSLFFPILLALYAHIVTQPTTGDYNLGLMLSIYMTSASDLILLTDPQISLSKRGQTSPPQAMSFSERLRWAGGLILNPRGIGWNFEPPNLRYSTSPRWRFVQVNFLWGVVYYLLHDLVIAHNRHNPAFQINGESPAARGFAWQIWNSVLFWLTFASAMCRNSAFMATFGVGLGLYEPADFPWFFGRWWNTTSIRTFWGRSWHQVLRRSITSHGKYFTREVMGFRQGTHASSYTQLFVAFFLSGLIHAVPDWMMSHDIHSFNAVIWYYVLQAIGITFEDMMIAVGKRLGVSPGPGVQVFGRVWVIFWIAVSSPIWMDTVARGGVLLERPPFSVVERLLGW